MSEKKKRTAVSLGFCVCCVSRRRQTRTISFKIWNQRDPKVPPPFLTRTNSRFRREAVPEIAGAHRNREYLDLQQKREKMLGLSRLIEHFRFHSLFLFSISFLFIRIFILFLCNFPKDIWLSSEYFFDLFLTTSKTIYYSSWTFISGI